MSDWNPSWPNTQAKSRSALTSLTPLGTSTWKRKMSRSSRCQLSGTPPPVNVSRTIWLNGPLGLCSPGIHLG
jgi:hypothetical protein